MRIDLHTHSLHSDGSDTPTQLIEKAKAAGLDVVALTDHDTTAGWAEALEAGERCGVRVVLGVEFSTTNEGRGQHLLGYGFNPEHEAVAEILAKAATSRADRAEALFAKMRELDKPVDRDFVVSLAGGIPSRKHVAAGLVKARHFKSDDQAFQELLNEDKKGYVERYRPSVEEAIAAIAAAGGVSVIAHPRDGKRGPGVSDERLKELADMGLNGVEVDHQAHSPEVREALRGVTAQLGLVATGASDHHGDRKVDHDLGCNLTSVAAAKQLLGKLLGGN